MDFHTFLESVYVKTNTDLQKAYTTYDHAKTLATKDLLDAQRSILKFVNYVHILGHYLLVKLHILKAPKTAQELFNDAQKVVPTTAEAPVGTTDTHVDV